MKKNNNRKGFTLIELLAVIVILAILMVAAGAAVMTTMNNAKINNFKNEALSVLNTATNAYTDISMSASDSGKYLVNSGSATYKGMCITLSGLVTNGYLDKDLNDGTTRGVVLVEVPFQGGATSYTIWMTDSTYGIPGYEKNEISSMKFKNENNNGVTADSYSSGTGVVTKLDGIDTISEQAYGTTSNWVPTTDQKVTISSLAAHGGTGETYTNIPCINLKID